MFEIGQSWKILLKDYLKSYECKKLQKKLEDEYVNFTIYPDKKDIFNAFLNLKYDDVKVVILGQDPYFNVGQAHGLAFSVKDGQMKPPSLINIFKEMQNDVGKIYPKSGCLDYLRNQGVLLLNTVLTVREHFPNSHKNCIGWEIFTDEIIRALNKRKKPLVFLLWGQSARMKKQLITNSNHLILESAHPSPLSAKNGFFNSKPFSKTNIFLRENKIKEIEW